MYALQSSLYGFIAFCCCCRFTCIHHYHQFILFSFHPTSRIGNGIANTRTHCYIRQKIRRPLPILRLLNRTLRTLPQTTRARRLLAPVPVEQQAGVGCGVRAGDGERGSQSRHGGGRMQPAAAARTARGLHRACGPRGLLAPALAPLTSAATVHIHERVLHLAHIHATPTPLRPSDQRQRLNSPEFEVHTGWWCPGAVGVSFPAGRFLEASVSLGLPLVDADIPPEAAALDVLVADLFFAAAEELALSSDAAVVLLASSN